jgi:hypothetical protein
VIGAFIGCVTMRSAPSTPELVSPLPFKGRLLGVPRAEAPPEIAASISNSSPIVFSYREELSHEHHTVPMVLSALNPLTYLGASTGTTGATAFADLSISNGDRVIGDYTAAVHATADYSIYSGKTYLELDREARAQVRREIDDKVYADLDRLTREIAASGRRQP